MRTRRELLLMGGAGAAAVALPSLGLPRLAKIVQAQGRGQGQARSLVDPLFREIEAQFKVIARGLAATPPRGNAQHIASQFRMLGVWSQMHDVNAVLEQTIEDAIALQGHHDIVSRIVAHDRAADWRANGLPVPANYRALTYQEAARSIGMLRAGAPFDRLCLAIGSMMERNAERFNQRMQPIDGQRPDPRVRLIRQDGPPPDDGGDCTQNPDGSFTCYFTDPNIIPGACDQQWGALFELAMAFLCWVDPALCPFTMLAMFGYQTYYIEVCSQYN